MALQDAHQHGPHEYMVDKLESHNFWFCHIYNVTRVLDKMSSVIINVQPTPRSRHPVHDIEIQGRPRQYKTSNTAGHSVMVPSPPPTMDIFFHGRAPRHREWTATASSPGLNLVKKAMFRSRLPVVQNVPSPDKRLDNAEISPSRIACQHSFSEYSPQPSARINAFTLLATTETLQGPCSTTRLYRRCESSDTRQQPVKMRSKNISATPDNAPTGALLPTLQSWLADPCTDLRPSDLICLL
ncbi:hypothetical protein QBC43DRAFT_116292 [Cladorrhinum sp. PSN259]|nr:hypothetical protein QBC43DRAFT_116292 [Cladorrhinum sp. PSN259]